MTIFLIVFAALMWLGVLWPAISSEETSYEKERREMYDRWNKDRKQWRDEGLRRVMNAEYRKGMEGYRDYLKNNI